MTLLDTRIARLDGTPTTLGELTGGKPALVVNVASQCGLTTQYSELEKLQDRFADRLAVVGVPCNQFGGQEPGSAEEIAEFCSTSYGVSFPMAEKVEVNGEDRHPLYAALVTADYDDDGGFKKSTEPGDVQWNFEKFLLDADGAVVARFAPTTTPDDPTVVAAVERLVG
ncbi:MAG: glutathione peroxidase [Nocardioides sp.]|nr:glutathione peroxidase [Nocardioides sp.]